MARRQSQIVQPVRPEVGQLLTIAEAGEYVRLSRTSLYNLMDAGSLPFVKFGKARRIAISALNSLVEQNTRTGASETA